jgi:hypothetical protein
MNVYIAEENYDGGGSYETSIVSIHFNKIDAEQVATDLFNKAVKDHEDLCNKNPLYKWKPEIIVWPVGGLIGQRSWSVSEHEVI